MKHLLLCFFACVFLSPFFGNSQDMNWTLFNFSPLSVNPANTGNFLGTYRIGGIIRDAAFGINNNSAGGSTNIYKSLGAHIDAPLALGFRKQDWIGVGGMFYGDRAGSGGLGLSYSLLSVAYHFADKKQKNIFTIGIQGGAGSRGIKDFQNLRFEDGSMNNIMPNSTGEIDNTTFFDLNFGVSYRSQVNKQTSIQIGATANQLSFAEQALIAANNTQTKRDSGLTVRPFGFGLHGTFDFTLNKKWDLSPTFRVQTFGQARELQLQSMAGYLINAEKELKARFGLGYRIGHALEVLLGMDIKAIRVGLAYDLSLGDITSIDNNLGGFELGVTYIGKIYKEPKIKPVILCPRY